MDAQTILLSIVVLSVILTPVSGDTTQQSLSINIEAPSKAQVGEEVSVSASVSIPDVSDSFEQELTVELVADGTQIASKTVTVQDGETTSVSFSPSFETTGSHTITVEGEITIAGQEFSDSASTAIEIARSTKTHTATPYSTPSVETKNVEGVAFTTPESLQDEVKSYRQNTPRDLGSHAFVVATKDRVHLVFTEKKPQKGLATVEGISLGSTVSVNGVSFHVLKASSVSIETEGESATVPQIAGNPSSYSLELVQVEASHRQVSTLTDPDSGNDFTASTSSGVLTENQKSVNSPFDELGRKGTSLSVSSSTQKVGPRSEKQVKSLLSSQGPRLYTADLETRFWSDSTASVDGIVLPPDTEARRFIRKFDKSGIALTKSDGPLLYIVKKEYDVQTYSKVNTVKQQSEIGEIVSIKTNLYGRTLSTQETLETSTPCGDSKAQIPTPSGPVCIDIVQDTLIHSGIIWTDTPDSKSNLLFVVGLSSQHLDQPSTQVQGHYRIVGKIVSTTSIDESLPEGKVLVIYELQRTGEIETNPSNLVESRLQKLKEQIRGQIFDSKDKLTQKNTTSQNISSVSPGEPAVIRFSQQKRKSTGLQEVRIETTTKVQNVEIKAKKAESVPSRISSPPSEPIRVLNITVSNVSNSDIKSATLELTLEQTNIQNLDRLVIYRYHEGEWQTLNTDAHRSNGKIVVQAETPGFSYFSVSLRENTKSTGSGSIPLPTGVIPYAGFGLVVVAIFSVIYSQRERFSSLFNRMTKKNWWVSNLAAAFPFVWFVVGLFLIGTGRETAGSAMLGLEMLFLFGMVLLSFIYHGRWFMSEVVPNLRLSLQNMTGHSRIIIYIRRILVALFLFFPLLVPFISDLRLVNVPSLLVLWWILVAIAYIIDESISYLISSFYKFTSSSNNHKQSRYDDSAFAVRFSCGNCANEWETGFRERDRVSQEKDGVRVNLHDSAEGKPTCPVCSVVEDITIEDRRPLED